MNSLTRGIRNAFRNVIRTVSVVAILAISVGLALIMLLSLIAVQDRIGSVQSSVGNTITVSPAGVRGMMGGGNLLSQDDVSKVASLNHVSSVNQSLTMPLTAGTDTSLAASLQAGGFGQRNGEAMQGGDQESGGGGAFFRGGSGGAPRQFTPPVIAEGIQDPQNLASLSVNQLTMTAGKAFAAGSSSNVALVGTDLAAKNNLKPGSTFTLFNQQVTVNGVYDAGNHFLNSSLVVPVKTLQTLSGSAGQVSSMIITADSSGNVQAVSNAVKNALGSNADVVSQQDSTSQSLSSLQGVKTVATYSLGGALISAAAILFLIMLMIVRERRQEIGVLKAIGASNLKVIKQFISESLTFTVLGSLVGLGIGVAFSNPVLNVLVNNASSSGNSGGPFGGGGPRMIRGGGFFGGGRGLVSAQHNALQNISAVINYQVLLYGLLVAIFVAIVGTLIPAWTIAKIRPAEAMNGE